VSALDRPIDVIGHASPELRLGVGAVQVAEQGEAVLADVGHEIVRIVCVKLDSKVVAEDGYRDARRFADELGPFVVTDRAGDPSQEALTRVEPNWAPVDRSVARPEWAGPW
jgi:hypothetical protein